MALSFPSSPSNGQTYNYNGDTYIFDGKRWKSQAQSIDLTPFATETWVNSQLDNVDVATSEFVTAASSPSNPVVGQTYFNTTDDALKIYSSNSEWGSVTFSPLGSQQNPAASALDIIEAGASKGDGVYWLSNPSINSGAPFPAYCDMTKDGGGWILVLTVRGDSVSYMGWNYTNIVTRNTTAPSLQNAYSIIGWSDYLKRSSGNWQWMVEATDSYTTRYTWGGIFTANVNSYSLNTTSAGQTNVTVNEWFNLSGFVNNTGVGPRVPFKGSSTAESPNAIYTTYPGSSSWWGTIAQSDTNFSSYRTGPWISGSYQAPHYKRVWIR